MALCNENPSPEYEEQLGTVACGSSEQPGCSTAQHYQHLLPHHLDHLVILSIKQFLKLQIIVLHFFVGIIKS